jgi:hypothetical protein
MPQHKIEISQPPKSILHSDVTFSVYSDDVLLGELRISKGSIDWRPPHARKAVQRRWERFARMMGGD